MSVPLRHRSENKLQAYKDTLAFCHYTIKIIENEKYFLRNVDGHYAIN